jgi:hypothetical protein
MPVPMLTADLTTLSKEALIEQIQLLQLDRQKLADNQYIEESLGRFTGLLYRKTGQSLHHWAKALLEQLIPYLQGLQASFYQLVPEKKQLEWVAGYADLRTETQKPISLGQGPTGQTALDGQLRYFDFLKDSIPVTYTGLADILPAAALVLPLIQAGNVEGVLEMTALQPLSEVQLKFLIALSDKLATALQAAKSQIQIESLYQEAEARAAQLQAQENTLRQNLYILKDKEAELLLQQQEILKFRQLVENSRLLMGILSIDTWQFEYLNPVGIEKLRAIGSGSLLQGRMSGFRLPMEVRKSLIPAIQDNIESTGYRSWEGIIEVQTPENMTLTLAVRVSPLSSSVKLTPDTATKIEALAFEATCL